MQFVLIPGPFGAGNQRYDLRIDRCLLLASRILKLLL